MTYQAAITTSAVVSKLLLYGEGVGYPESSSSEKSKHCSSSAGDHQFDSSYLLDRPRVACISAEVDCSSWAVVYFMICAYLSIAVIANAIACYKFIAAWNSIVNERRIDLKGFVQRRRRLTLKDALRTHVTIETMTCSSCCICLSDFEENELVTACDDGCHEWYHKECLFNWLDHSNDCPCCRIDMLSKKPKGLFSDLAEFVGFTEN
mmetsp:Transcript_8583/g.11340  ORF Transcript_8583/g.11340 Transcript_8583/m.11340 type:complete len:207 (+) Transcript_8583:256-876(+)